MGGKVFFFREQGRKSKCVVLNLLVTQQHDMFYH